MSIRQSSLWLIGALLGATLMAPSACGQEAPRGNTYAFLVACSKYRAAQLNPLKFTHNDILRFRDALLRTGSQKGHILLLHDKTDEGWELMPTRNQIREKFAKFRELPGENDTLIVALAGHGVQFDKDERNYFCPVDADLDKRESLIDLQWLYDELKQCPARRKLLLVDACRNDPLPENARAARPQVKFVEARPNDLPQGIVALFSCAPQQKSYEDQKVEHGIFFYHLLAAWNGAADDDQGQLTLDNLFRYTLEKTREHTFARYAEPQVPQRQVHGVGSWVIWQEPVGERQRWTGHEDMVWAVAFSPSGRWAVSGGYDREVRLWDVATGKELRRFSGHQQPVYCLATSPDERWLLTGSIDRTLRLWDLNTGKEVRRLGKGAQSVYCLAFTQDSRRAVSGGSDRTLRLWDVDTGKELKSFSGHQAAVRAVALSPDGTLLLSAGEDGSIRLWDVAAGKELRRFGEPGGVVWSVAFSSDGRRALSGGEDKTVRLWEVATGAQIRAFGGHTQAVLGVAFSRDGRRVFSGGQDATLLLWDIETGKEIFRRTGLGERVQCVALSPDGRSALSGGRDSTVRLWGLPRK